MSEADNILTDLKAMATAVAPELDLYIVQQPADAWETPLKCDAYAMFPFPTARQRDHLISIGQWNGPAPMIVFIGVDRSNETIGALLHELSHCLPAAKPAADVEPTRLQRVCEDEAFSRMAYNVVVPGKPWAQHGSRFIRRCLHLHYRAVNLCRSTVRPQDLQFAGSEYSLSPPVAYLQALALEPDVLRACTFSQIEQVPAPEAFSQLFADDVQRWHEKQTEERAVA